MEVSTTTVTTEPMGHNHQSTTADVQSGTNIECCIFLYPIYLCQFFVQAMLYWIYFFNARPDLTLSPPINLDLAEPVYHGQLKDVKTEQ